MHYTNKADDLFALSIWCNLFDLSHDNTKPVTSLLQISDASCKNVRSFEN